MFENLYAMWLDAHERNALPPEWALFIVFRSWAIENDYKAEYGYDGKFSADNLMAAIPGAESGELKDDAGASSAASSNPTGSFITGNLDADDLVKKLKLDELSKLAADMSIAVEATATKKEIAALIAAVEVSFPVDECGAFKGDEMPEWVKANPAVIGAVLHKEG